MKLKSLITATCILVTASTAPLLAGEPTIAEILAPGAQGLVEHLEGCASEGDIVAKGSLPVYANNVVITVWDGCTAHIGYYLDGQIVTIIKDPKGRFADGAQAIVINGNVVSQALSVGVQVINGIQYAHHVHNLCDVYSTE